MIQDIHILKTYPGCHVYELNIREQSISVLSDVTNIGGGIVKYVPKEDHWYEVALNEKSAFKKFNKKAMRIVTGKPN